MTTYTVNNWPRTLQVNDHILISVIHNQVLTVSCGTVDVGVSTIKGYFLTGPWRHHVYANCNLDDEASPARWSLVRLLGLPGIGSTKTAAYTLESLVRLVRHLLSTTALQETLRCQENS